MNFTPQPPPRGVTLFLKKDVERLASVEDLSLTPAAGFERLPWPACFGGLVALALFDTNREAEIFTCGVELADRSGKVTHMTDLISAEGSIAHAVLVHFGDSEDDELQVVDKRTKSRGY